MPFANQIHVDRLLSEVSVRYSNADYIAERVFPILNVAQSTNLYRVWRRNFRIPETLRANKAVSREHNFEVSTASYALEKHSLKDYVSDDDVRNYDQASLRSDTVEELTDTIKRRMEKEVADLFTSTSWSLNVSLASASQFSANTTVSNPIPVFDTAATTVIQNSGMAPNYGIIPREVFINIKNHVSVLDRIKYTSAEISETMIASLMGLQEIMVPAAQIDSSAEGVADSIGPIWGDNCFVGYKPGRPSPLAPSSGYIFREARPMVKRWRVEEREAEAIEVTIKFDPKVVASLSGYLIKDCNA